jgi:hypothetical protein
MAVARGAAAAVAVAAVVGAAVRVAIMCTECCINCRSYISSSFWQPHTHTQLLLWCAIQMCACCMRGIHWV